MKTTSFWFGFFFFSFRSSSARLVAPLGCLVSRQKHTLPDLPYDYAALEPHINAEIMQLHHSKHHATYVNNLNVAEEKYKEALAKGLYIHSQQGRWKLIGIDDTGELKKKKKREMFSFKSFGLCHCNIVRRKSFIVASVMLIIGNQMWVKSMNSILCSAVKLEEDLLIVVGLVHIALVTWTKPRLSQ